MDKITSAYRLVIGIVISVSIILFWANTISLDNHFWSLWVDINEEANLFTWFSATVFLALSVSSFMVVKHISNYYFIGLGVLAGWLFFDESSQAHETIVSWLNPILPASWPDTFWLLSLPVVGLLVLLFVIYVVRTRGFPRQFLWLSILGIFIWGLALWAEFAQNNFAMNDSVMRIWVFIEEYAEIYGAVMLILANYWVIKKFGIFK